MKPYIDPTQYKLNRYNLINQLKKDGINPYPHIFKPNTTFSEFVKLYHNLENGERLKNKKHILAGRILLSRCTGNKLSFYTFESDNICLQILADVSWYQDKISFKQINKIIKRGDIIGVSGCPGKSKKGELSIIPEVMTLLSPCYQMLPKDIYAVKDINLRYRKRYLDFIINRDNRNIFITRNKVMKFIRNYLNDLDFIEVETPILDSKVGGATAKPFITYHKDLKQEMYMRIAPKLY